VKQFVSLRWKFPLWHSKAHFRIFFLFFCICFS
jgi:hypothetical protein